MTGGVQVATGMRRMGSDLHSHNGYLYTFRMLYTVTYLCILWYRLHKGTVAGQHAHFEAMVQATAVLTCVCPKSGHFLRIVPRPRLRLKSRMFTGEFNLAQP